MFFYRNSATARSGLRVGLIQLAARVSSGQETRNQQAVLGRAVNQVFISVFILEMIR